MPISSRILYNICKTVAETSHVEKIHHIPVMANEIVRALAPKDGQKFIDMTFGGGGHTKHLLATNKKITIFCLDRDPEAFERAIVLAKDLKLKNNGQQIIPLLGKFSELPTLMNNWNVPKYSLDGAIMDLGTSTFQLEDGRKGFSLQHNGPLDMRMDGQRFPNMPTASDVVNSLDADELAKIFKTYGEEKHSNKIAQAIVDARFMMKTLNTTYELATLVDNVMGIGRTDQIGRPAHAATKIFQALRIFVNNELNEINYAVQLMSKYLKRTPTNQHQTPCDRGTQQTSDNDRGGLLAAISFHSLEDRIIKNHFMGYDHSITKLEMDKHLPLNEHTNTRLSSEPKLWKFYGENILYPSENEVFLNPKARSAKLRIGVRLH